MAAVIDERPFDSLSARPERVEGSRGRRRQPPRLSHTAGFQVRDWSRRGFEDRTSFGGTFYFASLDPYVGGAPYAFSRAHNDTNGIASYPANDYDLSGEWARANFDRPHSFLLLGRVGAWRVCDFGVGLTPTSAGPYTELLGQDVFNNGRGGARPRGVARNTLSGSGFASLDLRVSRELKFGGPKNQRAVTLGLDAFNVLNRVNYGTYVGTMGSPLFGLPVSARAARQLQLSMRFSF